MNYQKIYNCLIYKRLTNIIDNNYEIHHILPKSLGGSDEEKNLVRLTPREHFIAHKILVKITTNDDQNKMIYALWRMTNSNGYSLTSREYEYSRRLFKERLTLSLIGNKRTLGYRHSEEEIERRRKRMLKNKISLGVKRSEETCKLISESKKGKKREQFSDEWKSKLSKAKIGNKPSKETREKLSKSHSGKLNSQTKRYLVVMPDGLTFSWINGLNDLCREYELSLSRISKYLDQTIPYSKNIGRPCTKEGKNSDGWTVKRY